MGKAKITGGGTNGLYNVKIQYNMVLILKQIEALTKLIEELQKSIDDITQQITTKESEINTNNFNIQSLGSDINVLRNDIAALKGELVQKEAELDFWQGYDDITQQLEADIAIINQSIATKENEHSQKMKESEELEQSNKALKNEIDSLNIKRRVVLVNKLSAEKKKDKLEDIESEKAIETWCADLTEDLAVDAEVGLIQISGEGGDETRDKANYNIQYGFDGNATYNSERDGIQTPILGMTVAQTFYNYALFTGWQKWIPLYRYAKITNLAGDYAEIELDIWSNKSSAQNLLIDKQTTIDNVPIEYMDCHGAAFKENDIVIVQFDKPAKKEEIKDSEFKNPKIIGFKDNPQPCVYNFLIYREDGEEITDVNIGMTYIDFYNPEGDWIWTEFSYNTTLGLWEITFVEDESYTNALSDDGYFVVFTCQNGVYIEYPRTFEIEEMQNEANLIKAGTYFVSIPICFRTRTWTPDVIHISDYDCPANNPDINSFDSVVNSLNPAYYGDFLMFNDNHKTLEQKLTFQSSLDYKIKFSTDAGYGTYIKNFPAGYINCAADHDAAKITVISSDFDPVILEPYLEDIIDADFTTVFDATYTHHTDEVNTMLTSTQVNTINDISVLRGVWKIDLNGEKTGRNLIFNADWELGERAILFDKPLYDELEDDPIDLMLDYIELPAQSLMTKEHTTTYYDQSTAIADRRYTALDGYIYMMSITTAPYRINFNSNYQSGF